jgi:hypothetical protein
LAFDKSDIWNVISSIVEEKISNDLMAKTAQSKPYISTGE